MSTSSAKENTTVTNTPSSSSSGCVAEDSSEKGSKKLFPKKGSKNPEQYNPDEEYDEFELDPRKQQWSESLKARLFGSADKDGNFFSFMFLDKIFGESRPCSHCGARGSAKLPPGDHPPQLFVIEEGIIGKQEILCEKCDAEETVISGDDPSLLPRDARLAIRGMEIRDYCKKITHYEVLHDLMEMLHIAAMDDGVARRERHHDVAAFMLRNARKICEEWCRPEHTELRLRKYLRLREETLLTKYKPTFTPDCTEEFKEMYEMMAQSFRQNRSNIVTLLQLLKESLIDNPSRSTFMMWTSIAMLHSENYPQFKQLYDPRSFMRIESQEYQTVQDNYLSLDVPIGIKKIPIIFVLFEIPRFYHYVNFLNQRLGKRKPRGFLTEQEWAELKVIDGEESKLVREVKKRKKTKTMVSPEAHLDFLTQQEEIEREKVYQSCREKKALKEDEEAQQLGQDFNRKALPKPKNPKAKENATPNPVVAPDKEEDKPLTKAQIKRRKKKAAASKLEEEPATVSEKAKEAEKLAKEEHKTQSAIVESSKSKSKAPDTSSYRPGSAAEIALQLQKATDARKNHQPLSEEALAMLSEQQDLEAVLLESMAESHSQQDRAQKIAMIKDLAITTYPVVSDLLNSMNTLARPLDAYGPREPIRVSVLADPFSLYHGDAVPESGAIAFIRRQSVVRDPLSVIPVPTLPDSRRGSMPPFFKITENFGLSQAAKMTSEGTAQRKKDVPSMQYVFVSLESKYFPSPLRGVFESMERRGELRTVMVSEAEYREVLISVERYGIPHADVRHDDRESVIFFPSDMEHVEWHHDADGKVKMSTTRMFKTKDSEPATNVTRKPVSKVFLNPDPRAPPPRNITRRGKKDVKPIKSVKYNFSDHHAVMVTEMDNRTLQMQGYKVDPSTDKSTVICNKSGSIMHVMDGKHTPDEIKDFLAERYDIIAQQTGPGYLTAPTKEHPRGLMVDAKTGVIGEIPRQEKISGNRKKIKGKKKPAPVDKNMVIPLPNMPKLPPRNPYADVLWLWANQDGPWPKGLDYNTEYHYDREILCESDDEELVAAIDKDEFGNHAMLMRLELTSVDAPNEAAAQTVTRRYMEPADLGPGIDPKVPRFIIPSSQGPPDTSKKLPVGTTKEDLPLFMRFIAPHKQMRTLDAMKIPYKYEMKQLLTPHVNDDGEEIPDSPKRIALLTKLTLLPKHRYKSLMPAGQVKEEESKEEKPKEEVKQEEEEEEEDVAPKISKSQRKRMKKKQKLAITQDEDTSTADAPSGDHTPTDPNNEEVRSKLDHSPDSQQEKMEEEEDQATKQNGTEDAKQVPARNKFRACDNCGQEITSRILVCAGCKKVAYCNFRCQKASWKLHKKSCSYALGKDGKESTG